MTKKDFTRKEFLRTTGALAAGTIISAPAISRGSVIQKDKRRIAVVGTGVRGVGMFGRSLRNNYSDFVDVQQDAGIVNLRLELIERMREDGENEILVFEAEMHMGLNHNF